MSDDNTDAEAYGRSPEPNPDLRSLDRLVGTWGMSGPPETKSSPALDACPLDADQWRPSRPRRRRRYRCGRVSGREAGTRQLPLGSSRPDEMRRHE